MVKIGLLSDTHGYWDDKYEKYFADCDEIWHVGDVGAVNIIYRLEKFKPLRGVYGNIDDHRVRAIFPGKLRFTIEEVEVLMIHIGGYPGRYDMHIKDELKENPPQLFISGHSHILKVMYDGKLKCLHINPGAAGKQGFHKQRTIVRFTIDKKEIKDLEVIELNDK